MKIAVIGAQGIGKSTLCRKLYSKALREDPEAQLINEIVRKSPYPINDGMCAETAMWIIAAQLKAELTALANKKCKYIICDRCPFDAVIYNNYADIEKGNIDGTDNDEIEQMFYAMAMMWLETYDKIVLVTGFDKKNLVNDGVRSQDIAYGKEIDQMFKDAFLTESGVQTFSDHGFDENRLMIIESDRIFAKDTEVLCSMILS